MGKGNMDKERIERLCRLSGVHSTKKTVENIKGILETYSSIRDDLEYLPRGVMSDEVWKEASDIFTFMSRKEMMPIEKRETILATLIRSGQFEKSLNEVMSQIKNFSSEGETYYTILYMLYLDKEPHKNAEIQREVGYGHTAYQEKKELAILLFGLLFWKKFLDHWENSTEEMLIIEKNLGRDGSLSENKVREELLDNEQLA